MTELFELKSKYNTIKGVLVIPDGHGPFPCVVLSHGLVSSKESSKYVALSEILAREGIAGCRFDYHGCGESGGDLTETTLTIRLENLDAVVEYVMGHRSVDPGRIGLLGSSFGGTTSVLKAARDRRIGCISFWATPYKVDRPEDGQLSDITFKDAIYTDFAAYDILDEARSVCCALGIHGEYDEVVPWQEGDAIFRQMAGPKEFELIKGADHVFSDPLHRERAIGLAVNWFKRLFFDQKVS